MFLVYKGFESDKFVQNSKGGQKCNLSLQGPILYRGRLPCLIIQQVAICSRTVSLSHHSESLLCLAQWRVATKALI